MKVTIYCIVDPFTLKVRYIGRTKLPLSERLQYHLGKAKHLRKYGLKTSHTHNWLNQCVDRGKKPVIRKLCEIIGWTESHVFEKGLIAKYEHRLTNHDDKGEGNSKNLSEETRKQISDTLKKKYLSGEVISPSKKEIHVYNLKGQYITSFGSIKECSMTLNVSKSKIPGVIQGVYKQLKGYQFSYEKVDKLNSVSRQYENGGVPMQLFDSELGQIITFSSLSICNTSLNLGVAKLDTKRLPYHLKKNYGNRYSLIKKLK